MHPFRRYVFAGYTHFEEKFSLDALILSGHGISENSPPKSPNNNNNNKHNNNNNTFISLICRASAADKKTSSRQSICHHGVNGKSGPSRHSQAVSIFLVMGSGQARKPGGPKPFFSPARPEPDFFQPDPSLAFLKLNSVI